MEQGIVKSELSVKGLLSGAKLAEIQQVAGRAMSGEKLIKLFAMAASRQPKLMECTPLSMLSAMVQCAELRLTPGTMGSVHLIPYWNGRANKLEVQMIIGYRGLVELARRSGNIESIQAEVVRQGDDFRWSYGLETEFKHTPKGDLKSPITHVWALAKFVGGGHHLIVMRVEEVDAIRQRAKKDNGPWATDFPEMAKKTAIRRLCKYLPMTIEAAEAIEASDRAEFGFGEMTAVSDAPAPEALAERIKQATGTVEAAESEAVTEVSEAPKSLADIMADNPPANVTRVVRRRDNGN